ncbi:hypothetical protein BH10ACT8_BH10ACT8_18170 [soil metagenome]
MITLDIRGQANVQLDETHLSKATLQAIGKLVIDAAVATGVDGTSPVPGSLHDARLLAGRLLSACAQPITLTDGTQL